MSLLLFSVQGVLAMVLVQQVFPVATSPGLFFLSVVGNSILTATFAIAVTAESKRIKK
jgi:hypothetical protein